MVWLLHGNLGNTNDWKVVRHFLSQRACETRALDLWMLLECCGMSLEDAGRALYQEIKRVDQNPVIVGYSMGGRLALHAIKHDPAFWRSAIFLSTHPGIQDRREKELRLKRDTEWAIALKREENFGRFLEEWDAQSVLSGTASQGRMRLASRKSAIARAFIHWSLGNQEDFLPVIANWSLPTCWLAGENDQKFSEFTKQAASMSTNSQSEIIPNSGHRLLLDAPERIGEIILSMV